MRYYIDLFSPETAKAFENSKRDVSGFRISRKAYVQNQRISSGDRFICYITRIQRFVGILEVKEGPYQDEKPIFTEKDDPFILRFKVEPIVWLPLEKSIPIHEDHIWNFLSFTKNLPKESNQWTYMVFSSPRLWPLDDCVFLEKILLEQAEKQVNYPLTENDLKKIKTQKIRITPQKEVSVSVPDDEEIEEMEKGTIEEEKRRSTIMQAKLSEIGEKLGFKIWIPNNDRMKVLGVWTPKEGSLIEDLPIVFDETTLKIIKNIDVLWIRGRAIVRAFEVEDTTSIYSGILRMADLLAIQPMLNIKIHLVAPTERRELVFKQITRPIFTLFGDRPLSEVCSYISYDSIDELLNERRLEYMTDTIVEEYSDYFED